MEFSRSQSLSLGIELELQLVRAHDRDLAHEAGDLIERLAQHKVPGEVKPEVTLSMIELNSTIQSSYAGALAELEAQRAVVKEAAGVTARNSVPASPDSCTNRRARAAGSIRQ